MVKSSHRLFLHKHMQAASSPKDTKLDRRGLIVWTVLDGAEGGHHVYVCLFG